MSVVLVDSKKLERAKQIVAILKRGANPVSDEEKNLHATYTRLMSLDKVKKEDLLEYVYTKLGGLVRTEEEQKVAEKKAQETKKKYYKDQVKDKNDED